MQAAIADYGRALANAQSDKGKLYYSRATLRYNSADYQGVLEDCTAAIDNQYRAPEVYSARGSAYAQLGLLDEAVRDYASAIELDLRDAVAFYNRGAVYYQQGKHAEAIKDFSRAIALQPENVAAYYARAIAYADMQDWANARRDLTQVIKVQPNNAAALHRRGTAYQQRGNLDKALADFQQAIELAPRTPAYYTSLGELYIEQGNFDEAILALKRAVLQQEDATALLSTRILAGLAVAYYQQGDMDNTLRYWNMVLERDMRYADVAALRATFGWTDSLITAAAAMIATVESAEE
jgi:tetratricopeptide (TPR) repeat protein